MIEKGFKTPEDTTGQTLAVTAVSTSTTLVAINDEEHAFVDLTATVNMWIQIESYGTPGDTVAMIGRDYFLVALTLYRFPAS